MNGTLRQTEGKWYVVTGHSLMSEPVMVTNRYRVTGTRPAPGNYGPAPQLAEGLEVMWTSSGRPWEAYRQGAYLLIETENEAVQSSEPIPRPATRVEVRYRDGRWEKYVKRSGWIAALTTSKEAAVVIGDRPGGGWYETGDDPAVRVGVVDGLGNPRRRLGATRGV